MKFNLNKIILITGGFDHIDAYRFLIRNNIDVIIFDDDPNCFIKQKYENLDIKIIKGNHNKIMSYKKFCWSPCNDFGSKLADKINKINNFPTRSLNQKFIFDKLIQKKIFFKNNILTPNLVKYKKNKSIFKHRKGSGSKNITLENKNHNKNFYSEEFINGREISVDTLTTNNSHSIIMTSFRDLDNYKSACSIVSLPNLIKNRSLIKIVNDVLNCLKIINGVCHLEFIFKNKKFYIIDANIRCGGFGVTNLFLHKIKRQNIFKLDLYSILNLNIKLNKSHQYACLIFTRYKSKKIKDLYNSNNTFSKIIKLNFEINYLDPLSDTNRNEIICLFHKTQKKLLNELKKFYHKNYFDKLIKDLNYMNSVK